MKTTSVLTADELFTLIHTLYPDRINLEEYIHYFHYRDCRDNYLGGQKHIDSLRFVVVHDDNFIYGVCKFAWWEIDNQYAVSYLSTNKLFFKQGISKMLLEGLFMYFSNVYTNETLHLSGYSVEGWKYLRNTILEMSVRFRVTIQEKAIEYVTGGWNDEKRKLYEESKEIIKNTYKYELY